MGQVICSSCFEVEDTTKRFIELPYVCALCEKDSALTIEQDVWETEYVGPACQQAAEEVHGLYIDEEDDIPCDDATTYYIIEARSKSSKRFDDWFRSENDNTKGIFDDYSTALEAAEREPDGSSIEYRVVEYRPEPTPCDIPYNSGVPCQSALDSVQADVYDQYAHNSEILDQFNADTKLIDDLRLQLEQAILNVQILEETIEDLETQLTDLRLDICNVVDAAQVALRSQQDPVPQAAFRAPNPRRVTSEELDRIIKEYGRPYMSSGGSIVPYVSPLYQVGNDHYYTYDDLHPASQTTMKDWLGGI